MEVEALVSGRLFAGLDLIRPSSSAFLSPFTVPVSPPPRARGRFCENFVMTKANDLIADGCYEVKTTSLFIAD